MGFLSAAILLAGAGSGQAVKSDPNVFLPLSSIDRPQDRGKRAHTNYGMWLGPTQSSTVRSRPGPNIFVFTGSPGGFSAQELQNSYGGGAGSGIIAIVDAYEDPYLLNDFNVYSSEFGLPQEPSSDVTASTNKVFQVVYQGGTEPPEDPYDGGWAGEEALDMDMAHALAPNAKVILIETQDDSFENLLAGVDLAVSLGAREVSMSWLGDEWSDEVSYDFHFKSTTASFFGASGDTGTYVGWPSASPYVISCGGTALFITDGGYGSEQVWGSGGGGPSTVEPVPGFQKNLTAYDANGNKIALTGRGTPDISAVANWATGVASYDSYQAHGWWIGGGTSVAAPLLAGVQNNTVGIRHAVELLYMYSNPSKFHDLTTGTNGWAAGPGYDYANGLGSPRGAKSL